MTVVKVPSDIHLYAPLRKLMASNRSNMLMA